VFKNIVCDVGLKEEIIFVGRSIFRPCVNFINTLRLIFLQTLFWQLFSSYIYAEKAAEMMFVQNIRT